MLDAYRGYFATLLADDLPARIAARSIARSTRTNAQASLERLRGEPRPDRRLLAFAEGVFANANRFVRACMSLEASLQDARGLPERAVLAAFSARIEARLAALCAALRGEESTATGSADDLRADERSVAERLGATADEHRARLAAEVIDTFDRMTDSIDTLTHVIAQAEPGLRRET
jgi:hypothetical protein